MTRMCLNIRYGREQLEQNEVTAKGTRQGQLGIHPYVRKALRAFVNRNVQAPFHPLDEAEFNRVINRMNCQLHRVSSSKKGTPTSRRPAVNKKESKKAAAKRKSPIKQTEKSPVKIVSPRESPVKLVTPRKSPWKAGTVLDSSRFHDVVRSPQKTQWEVSRMASKGAHQGNPVTVSSHPWHGNEKSSPQDTLSGYSYPAYSQGTPCWPYAANSYQGSLPTSAPAPSYFGHAASTSTAHGQPGTSSCQGSAQPDNWYNNLTTLY